MEVSVHLTDCVRPTADNPTAPSQGGSELCGDLLNSSGTEQTPRITSCLQAEKLQHCPRSIGTAKAEALRLPPRLFTLDSGEGNGMLRDSWGSQQTQPVSQCPIQFLHPGHLCLPSFQAITDVAGRFFHVVNSIFMLLKNNPSMPDEDVLVKLII